MYPIPMGHFGLVEVAFVSFADRKTDIFFAGSIDGGGQCTVRPQTVARRQMSAALAATRGRFPELPVESGLFASQRDGLTPDTYSGRLDL
jgi:hypothetical protein